jgi:hypothetical protein
MRKALLLILVGAVWTGPAGAANTAVNEKKIATYCSPSGDVCYGIFNRAGKVYLRITTAAHYFRRYKLCVRLLPAGSDALHAQRCGLYPVFRQGGSTWGSSINYARQFPIKNPGRYRVAWKLGSSALGPPLIFRLPARS